MRGRDLKIGKGLLASSFALLACMVLAVPHALSPARAQEEPIVVETPHAPPPDVDPPTGYIPAELPIEVETELAPAGSLKQAPLFKELEELLEDPYAQVDDPEIPGAHVADIDRRPSFLPPGCGDLPGAPVPCNQALMPPLKVYGLDDGVLTDETLRLRTSDGEISWDQQGFLFDPDDVGPGWPDEAVNGGLMDVIGRLVYDADNNLVVCNTPDTSLGGAAPCGLSDDSDDDPRLPPDNTIVARPAFDEVDGVLEELDPATQDGEPVVELETPINETDFFRIGTGLDADTAGVPAAFQPYIGRLGAEVLGKALFWDMQVGSDGIQACGSCHFSAGVDDRVRNQLNPDTLGGDNTLQVKGANATVVASDFPFRKLGSPDLASEGDPLQTVQDANDVMSSMGVRFRRFFDIPLPGVLAFSLPANGVRPLRPDRACGDPLTTCPVATDPVPVFQGLRRVEPRNTPTIFAAAFNFDNFWDGRARFHFNGGSVFGPADPQNHIFIDPGTAGAGGGGLDGATNGDVRDELAEECSANPDGEGCDIVGLPVRMKFSSLASLATGPALSNFEMSFDGRNWAKLGKKLLQGATGNPLRPFVTPLANQLVSPTDSRLGRFSNQGGPANLCASLPVAWRTNGGTAAGKPGLCINYPALIQLAFDRNYWQNTNQHLNGCFTNDGDPATPAPLAPTCAAGTEHDPFDGYKLTVASSPAGPLNTNQFTQMEANMSLFFGLGLQAWMELLIPDNTPFDQFMDANPLAANGVGQPGEQGVLPPDRIRQLVTGDPGGSVELVPGFGPDELFGFDIFSGANLTAALPAGSPRLNNGIGSNPFLRSGRCMICHLGPEQTDHTVNVNHGLILSDTEFELPPSGEPEPTGPFKTVTGFLLEEEIAEVAQDAVEVENRNFAIFDRADDPNTLNIDESLLPGARIGQANGIAFQDNGVYNIGVRPSADLFGNDASDIGRGGDDPFGLPLSLAALALKNLGGEDFEPCDSAGDACDEIPLVPSVPGGPAFDPGDPLAPDDFGGGLFEEVGEGALYPDCEPSLEPGARTCTVQDINPGLQMAPASPQLPDYLAPWANNLPAGELHPQIDELAFAPNTITPPPFAEFTEIQFGSDLHCALFDIDQFGNVAPNFGWGPLCPNSQSAVPNNIDPWLNGTWPVPNRVAREGAFKAPQLRNVELTGPYFHTGSFLTLRQVVDFYFRGGDFPITNAEHRDPNLVDIDEQAFGFGATLGLDLIEGIVLDGVPDTITMYGPFPYQGPDPDGNPIPTPEPPGSIEDVKDSLVKFLLSLTDQRVKLEQAPFDRPEMFLPVDGRAPDNLLGRAQLLLLSNLTCQLQLPNGGTSCFRRVPAVGAAGHPATPLPNFLGVSSVPDSPGPDHFDPVTQ